MTEKAEASAKRCTKCGVVKPISQFHLFGSPTGRRRPDCASCQGKYTKRWRRLNPERIRAQNRGRRTPQSPYWQQRVACQLAYWAVVGGFIPRKYNCEKCGIDARHAALHRHHLDYDRPLDVVWLCRRCHTAVHQKNLD